MSNRERVQTYLDRDFTEPIRDPLWNNIYLSPGLKKITHAGPFQELSAIRQLGPTYHVYPGATHTRLNHSLGVCHVARRMLGSLIRYPECPDLSLEGVKAFLSACLLHDLGHFPYAHSLKELPLKDHEILTGEIVLSEPLRTILKDEVKTDPLAVAAIVDTTMETADAEVLFFRNILSGVLDPDKMDYLNRDAYFCGVPYGIQDTEFVITKIRPHRNGLALTEQGLPAVENILFSKYLMYRTVYWHKVVRIATAMIKKAIFFGLQDVCIRPDDLYGLTDQAFSNRFGREEFPYHRLIRGVTERRLYKSVWEEHFDIDFPAHAALLDLSSRFNRETEIAERLRSRGIEVLPEEIIIDIPENISFEISLPILTETGEKPFSGSSSVFTPPVVRSFTGSLRKLRLFVAPHLVERLPHPQEILGWNK
jgi:HD superfamily phosphohydrolase